MTTISICVGSACHTQGAQEVLTAFTLLLEKYKVSASVDLIGDFCQGRCTEGVVVKINEEIITKVNKEKVFSLFIEKVLGGDPV
ncbi:MAG: hypothetical protein H6Q67_957 [Firmicutes bacterium]|nr:hypothetical protein [Bacillota bacterium]